jgi:hypothetical protein
MDSNYAGWFEDLCRDARTHLETGGNIESLVAKLKSKGEGIIPIAKAIQSVNGEDRNAVLKDVRRFFREESGRY